MLFTVKLFSGIPKPQGLDILKILPRYYFNDLSDLEIIYFLYVLCINKSADSSSTNYGVSRKDIQFMISKIKNKETNFLFWLNIMICNS